MIARGVSNRALIQRVEQHIAIYNQLLQITKDHANALTGESSLLKIEKVNIAHRAANVAAAMIIQDMDLILYRRSKEEHKVPGGDVLVTHGPKHG